MANELLGQMSGAVGRMPAGRRVALLGGLVLVAALMIGVGMWASEPAWVVLNDNITFGEAAELTEALTKAGVRNKLGPDGSRVLVAKEDYPKARVSLAKAGLPRSGPPGWDLFDKQNQWGISDQAQRIMLQRALEGELTRTIAATNGVQSADVHLTIPEPTALRRNDRPAKAAVQLRMRPGMTLAPGAVQGIIATVSNAVDQLPPGNVVVTDETGRLLSAPAEDGSTLGSATRQMEMRESVENYLAGKAARLLETVAGLGVPRVQVTADLNFDQVERSVESFDPDGQVLTAEGRSETQAAPDGSGGQTIVNNTYQNSRKFEKILTSGGGVTRLFVSVAVDERALKADTANATPITDRLANVEALVRNAIGFDSTRGDRIVVKAVPFEMPVLDTTRAAPKTNVLDLAERFARPAVGLVALLTLLVMGLKTVGTIQAAAKTAAAAAGHANGRSGPAHQLPAASEPIHEIPPLGPPPETVLLKNKVVEESGDKPELMAQVVRAWMTEGTQPS